MFLPHLAVLSWRPAQGATGKEVTQGSSSMAHFFFFFLSAFEK